MVALDGEHEFELGFCYMQIKWWKRSWFRKNSKYPAKILLRAVMGDRPQAYWLLFLELSVNHKVKTQIRICEEAYDVLQRDMPKENYSGIEFVTLETFTPNKREN